MAQVILQKRLKPLGKIKDEENNNAEIALVRDKQPISTEINAEIRQEYSLSQEIGRLRKTIKSLIEILNDNGIAIDLPEFETYSNYVEQCIGDFQKENDNLIESD